MLTIRWTPPLPRRGVAGASRRSPPPRQLAVRLRWWGEPPPPAEGAPGSHGTLFRPRTAPSGHSAVVERDPSNTALFPVRCASEHLVAYLRDASAAGGLVLELLGSSARSTATGAEASKQRVKVIGRAIFDPAQLIKHIRSGSDPSANGPPLRHTCVLISRHDASRLGTILVEGEVRMGTRSQLRAALLLAQSGEERLGPARSARLALTSRRLVLPACHWASMAVMQRQRQSAMKWRGSSSCGSSDSNAGTRRKSRCADNSRSHNLRARPKDILGVVLSMN